MEEWKDRKWKDGRKGKKRTSEENGSTEGIKEGSKKTEEEKEQEADRWACAYPSGGWQRTRVAGERVPWPGAASGLLCSRWRVSGSYKWCHSLLTFRRRLHLSRARLISLAPAFARLSPGAVSPARRYTLANHATIRCARTAWEKERGTCDYYYYCS